MSICGLSGQGTILAQTILGQKGLNVLAITNNY